jgi:hypothetical protein
MPGPDGWSSASELAEYSFCPRAHFYHRQGEPPATRASAAGVRYHATALGSERWRDRHAGAAWAAVAVGLLLLALAALAFLR